MSDFAPHVGHAEPIRGLDRLLELQDLDLTIDRLKSRLAELEAGGDLRAARERLSEAESRMGELRLAIDAVAKEQRRMEGDVDSVERKIEAERKRLFDGSVANSKELQAIQHEVDSLQSRKGRMEDQVLEHMERREELEEHLAPIDVVAADARETVAQIEDTTGRELVEVERALVARRAERERIQPEFDEELLELYEDLRRQKRGVGAAALTDSVCQACHQQLSHVYLDRLRHSEGVRRCEYCRRILIFR